jgi:hypothetical protein
MDNTPTWIFRASAIGATESSRRIELIYRHLRQTFASDDDIDNTVDEIMREPPAPLEEGQQARTAPNGGIETTGGHRQSSSPTTSTPVRGNILEMQFLTTQTTAEITASNVGTAAGATMETTADPTTAANTRTNHDNPTPNSNPTGNLTRWWCTNRDVKMGKWCRQSPAEVQTDELTAFRIEGSRAYKIKKAYDALKKMESEFYLRYIRRCFTQNRPWTIKYYDEKLETLELRLERLIKEAAEKLRENLADQELNPSFALSLNCYRHPISAPRFNTKTKRRLCVGSFWWMFLALSIMLFAFSVVDDSCSGTVFMYLPLTFVSHY